MQCITIRYSILIRELDQNIDFFGVNDYIIKYKYLSQFRQKCVEKVTALLIRTVVLRIHTVSTRNNVMKTKIT